MGTTQLGIVEQWKMTMGIIWRIDIIFHCSMIPNVSYQLLIVVINYVIVSCLSFHNPKILMTITMESQSLIIVMA